MFGFLDPEMNHRGKALGFLNILMVMGMHSMGWMKVLSIIKYVIEKLIKVVGISMDLWGMWTLLSGKKGKLTAHKARMLFAICYIICAVICLIIEWPPEWIDDNFISSNAGFQNGLFLIVKKLPVRIFFVGIGAILLFHIVNYIFFHIGREVEGQNREPERYGKSRRHKKKRNK